MDYRRILKNYFAILDGKKKAVYLECKQIRVDFSKSDSIKDLWGKHDKAVERWKSKEGAQKTLLDLKIEIATRIFRNCHFCERRCGVDRTKVAGNCMVKEALIASEFLHMGEEYILIPSYTIFFSGCPFHCVFCQNWDISQMLNGLYVEHEILSKMIEKRKSQGALNVNWVGGDPTPNLPYILKVLKLCETNIPQIWNSNMYCSMETMKLLKGVIDLYLTDFKYGNNECAERLSKVKNYLEVVERNHLIAYKDGDMLVRHLVMPNHVECCTKPVIDWLSRNVPMSVVNVMEQYRPEYKAYEYPDISRPLKRSEYEDAVRYAKEKGLCLI